eukprot:g2701.t1
MAAEVWAEVLAVDVRGRRLLVLHDNLAHEWVSVSDETALEGAMLKRQEQQELCEREPWEREAEQTGKGRGKRRAKNRASSGKGGKKEKAAKGGNSNGGAAATSAARRWRVGELVQANYFESGRWFPGKISKANSDGTYDIDYDDGDKEGQVRPSALKAADKAVETEAKGRQDRKRRLEQRQAAKASSSSGGESKGAGGDGDESQPERGGQAKKKKRLRRGA